MQAAERRIYRISELNAEIKGVLEARMGSVWVEGEISNFKLHSSGHAYFSLKDRDSQLRAVCFKGSLRGVRFRPEDGLSVLAHGMITVYTPRGEYQLVVDAMEPRGAGSLLLAYGQLKLRLEKEGLFDPARKKALPLLPRRIAVVTSPTGAAIQDILNILGRRNSTLHVLLYPVRVQGEGAAEEITEAIRYLDRQPGIDAMIVGRGGGSIEDLWAFNEEIVARAIAACRVPVISAVGHETDVTIADFVADVRASTPSAAAELVSGRREELLQKRAVLASRLQKAMAALLAGCRRDWELLSRSRAFGVMGNRIRFLDQRLDELLLRSANAVLRMGAEKRARLAGCSDRLQRQNPRQKLQAQKSLVELDLARLQHGMSRRLEACRRRLAQLGGKLEALSPLGSLGRGYAICRDVRGAVLTDAARTAVGEQVRVRLAKGQLECRVEGVEADSAF